MRIGRVGLPNLPDLPVSNPGPMVLVKVIIVFKLITYPLLHLNLRAALACIRLNLLAGQAFIHPKSTTDNVGLRLRKSTGLHPPKSTGCAGLYSSKSAGCTGLQPPKSTGYAGLHPSKSTSCAGLHSLKQPIYTGVRVSWQGD